MLIELNYVFFSFLLVVYGTWRYLRRKNKYLLYLTTSFTFLAMSAMVQMLSSPKLAVHIIYLNAPVLKLLRLGGLALFACFTICAIMALRKIIQETTKPRS